MTYCRLRRSVGAFGRKSIHQMQNRLDVVVPTPAHSSLHEPLSYLSEFPLSPGTLVRVPLGKREVLGIVWDGEAATADALDLASLKPVAGSLDAIAPLNAGWRHLVTFSSQYYQRSLGEVALAA